MRQGVMRDYSSTISVLTRIFDVGLVAAAGWAAHALRFNGHGHFVTSQYATIILIGCLLAALLFPTMGLYQSWRAQGILPPIGRVLSGTLMLFFLLLALLAMVHQANAFSRLWFGYWAATTTLAMTGIRIGIYWALHALRARGHNQRNLVIVGCGPKADELYRKIQQNAWSGYHISAVFAAGSRQEMLGEVRISPIQNLASFLGKNSVDEVWIALPLEQTTELRVVLDAVRTSSANVRYAPDFLGLYLLNHGVSSLFETPMIDLSASPIEGINRLVKGTEDRALAAIIFLLASPLMIFIAIGVKLTSPGPILFRQMRHGWDGREIEVWKFRTMYTHHESQGRVTQASRCDPRVTPLGSWLRRTSLDELPQLINVLQGRMSLVGPRPHAIEHNIEYKQIIDRYMLRHKVKPGLTGWAQINGWRGQTDTVEKMQRRIEHDLYYIEHWSLWFDIKIIALTIFRGFVHQNAY